MYRGTLLSSIHPLPSTRSFLPTGPQEFVKGGQLYRMIGQNARLPNNTARFYAAQAIVGV